MSPQLCPGTFICQDVLSVQLLALTFPSPNSATGPHILHQSRIHSVRAQTNPLRVVHADTHRCCGRIFFHLHTGTYAIFRINSEEGSFSCLLIMLNYYRANGTNNNNNKKKAGRRQLCQTWDCSPIRARLPVLDLVVAGSQVYGPRERGLGPRSQRSPDAPA